MGARKRLRAEQRKEAKQNEYIARLRNCPTSPRKMRIVADLVRGKDVNSALSILKHSPQIAAKYLYKLVLSGISNWQAKNEGKRVEESGLYIKDIYVDSARILKRIQPAPQGRAHRIRKRSNHVTLFVDSRVEEDFEELNEE